jgi:hypothetical protein
MHSLRILVKDRFEQILHSVFREGRLKAGHMVQGNADAPDIAPLVIVLILYHLGRQGLWCTNELARFYVALVVEDS